MTVDEMALLENVLGAALARLTTSEHGYTEGERRDLAAALEAVRRERGQGMTAKERLDHAWKMLDQVMDAIDLPNPDHKAFRAKIAAARAETAAAQKQLAAQRKVGKE